MPPYITVLQFLPPLCQIAVETSEANTEFPTATAVEATLRTSCKCGIPPIYIPITVVP